MTEKEKIKYALEAWETLRKIQNTLNAAEGDDLVKVINNIITQRDECLKALKIVWADSQAFNLQWFEDNKHENCVKIIKNLRKWSESAIEFCKKS